ncbi:helix-turn-helix domain-containing protein [Oceanospirillum beijerinckii]|uniref:helix-turn-helix domain-containing protein n=1 Tax=Oceanospirillum beijerinckii TaxID=64976 RepID=UPI000686AFE9|nr:helix-turn-helix transcriptional regulator [Oceanospirillum beijerinckii]
MDIGKFIKQARKEAGLTQEELGIACGWDGGTPQVRIGYYENNKRKISAEDLAKIAKTLKKPISYFYQDAEAHGLISESAALYLAETQTSSTQEMERLTRIITKVEQITQDNQITLTPEQRARVIVAVIETEKTEQEESSAATIKAALRMACF